MIMRGFWLEVISKTIMKESSFNKPSLEKFAHALEMVYMFIHSVVQTQNASTNCGGCGGCGGGGVGSNTCRQT